VELQRARRAYPNFRMITAYRLLQERQARHRPAKPG